MDSYITRTTWMGHSMRLLLLKLDSITLTIIIVHLTVSPLCLLLLVRLGVYIVSWCAFHSYRLIGKLTAFLQFQEFYLRNRTVTISTSTVWPSPHKLKSKVDNILAKDAALRITLNIDGVSIASKSNTHPSHSQTSRL